MKYTILIGLLLGFTGIAKAENPDRDSVELLAEFGSLGGSGKGFVSIDGINGNPPQRINDGQMDDAAHILIPSVLFIKPATDKLTVLAGFKVYRTSMDFSGDKTALHTHLNGTTAQLGFRYYFDR